MSNSHQAGSWYAYQSKLIDSKLSTFWDPQLGFITCTLGQSKLDSSVILAFLHTNGNVLKDELLSTAMKLMDVFNQTFLINRQRWNDQGKRMGTAIGR